MSFRFSKRINILPGIGLNIGTHGASVSVGPRGFRLTFSPHGVRGSVGVPGTGISYSVPLISTNAKQATSAPRIVPGRRAKAAQCPDAQEEKPPLKSKRAGVPQRSGRNIPQAGEPTMRPWEQAAALYKAGKAQEVLDYFVGLTDDGVAQFAAAAILLDHGNLALALEHANRARHLVESNSADNYQRLTVSVGITEELRLELAATPEGVTLLIVEIQQRAGDNDQAIQNLRALLSQHGDDAIVKLSLVELLYDRACNDDNLHEVIRLAKRTEATDLACVGLILYKARALYKLGMYDGIPPIMEAIWDARQPLPRDLTLALRYQLGLTYEALGQPESARRQYHHIYAEDPDYEDITVRLRRLSS